MELLQEVLKEIKPSKSEEELTQEMIYDFISKLNKHLVDAKATLGGSGAKGTWLSDVHDADIFVQFNYKKYKNADLSDILEKVLKKIFKKIRRLHGSRDYFQIKKDKFTFEVVPILKISKAEDALNITDVSPLHADWVNRAKPLADEMRLTKQFCKARGIYGAESYIKGFSGYMCELLTMHYGGFLKLVKAASKWGDRTVLDTRGYYRNKNDVLFNINKSKQQGPLVLIDPVQKDRNAAAALNEEKYQEFIHACRDFLKKQSKDFFEIKEVSIDQLKKKAGKNMLILMEVAPLKGKNDVVGSKLLKVVEFIDKKLGENDFKVYGRGWKWDKDVLFWFVVDKKLLSAYVERKGPPLKLEKCVKDFKKKHKKTFIKGRNVWAKDKRKYKDSKKFVKFLIRDDYVTQRVNKIKIIP